MTFSCHDDEQMRRAMKMAHVMHESGAQLEGLFDIHEDTLKQIELLTPEFRGRGVPLKDLELPKSVIIAAIHRGNQVIIPNGDTVIEEDDRLLMLSLISDIASTEKLLKDSSKLGFFKGL